ncbi:patatin-like phospholipase family protein [Paenibacillus marinisediminis]
MKKVGLALGGGAVRGLAHIGVFKVLKQYQIPIEFIAGTSMGGAIGGLVAAGLDIEEVEEFALSLPSYRLMELGYRKKSILGGDKVFNLLLQFLEEKGLGDFKIEDTRIPFRAVSVDLMSGQQYIFDQGDLRIAIRATTAVPGVFAPVTYEDKVLVDGCVLNQVPADIVRNAGASIVLAVDVGPELQETEPKSMFDVMFRSLNIMMLDNVRRTLPYADIVFRPDVGQVMSYDLKKIRQCIDAGKQDAEARIAELLHLL